MPKFKVVDVVVMVRLSPVMLKLLLRVFLRRSLLAFGEVLAQVEFPRRRTWLEVQCIGRTLMSNLWRNTGLLEKCIFVRRIRLLSLLILLCFIKFDMFVVVFVFVCLCLCRATLTPQRIYRP